MAVITFTNKIKLTIFLFLAACMAAATGADVGASGVYDICVVTDFKLTCHKSLTGATGTKPKDLIKAALDAAAVELESVVKKSVAYKTVSSDNMTKGALIVCEDVLNTAIDDLRRSSEKVEKIEIGRLSFNIADVRNWLSATVSHKENCIDALESATGDVGEKVKAMLQTSSEMLSNGLAMIANTEPRLLGRDEEIPNVDIGVVAPPTRTVTVAMDDSGNFKNITEALKSLPQQNNTPIVVFVKAGTYYEYVRVPTGMNNIAIIGEGPLKTKISGNRSVDTGFSLPDTATLDIDGDGFFAKDIKIENTAPTSQAVAVPVNGKNAVFQNVHFESLQDTLYAQTYNQFYRDCRISGTIDFIFGDAVAVFQNCDIAVRKPIPGQYCAITAQGRSETSDNGVTVIQGCRITAENDFLKANPPVKAYLGRPWKEYSRTIIMQTHIDGFISPEGWSPWVGKEFSTTVYYGSWCNTGDGANTSKWVNWSGIHNLTMGMAQSFTPQKLFGNDEWVKKTRVPYVGGLLLPIQANCTM